ncbi:hypothetical protein ARMSODRAFT_979507 [Armillaria solidipes]|uniref:Uncharacterized protein n=1 Tax=Armillaria solidipes TaxID=1076256 RepID=A0A2H3BJ51_9AGAR|nr:hypothetical protein ARMSODRAFT_979507 [Armillaria solidipes]
MYDDLPLPLQLFKYFKADPKGHYYATTVASGAMYGSGLNHVCAYSHCFSHECPEYYPFELDSSYGLAVAIPGSAGTFYSKVLILDVGVAPISMSEVVNSSFASLLSGRVRRVQSWIFISTIVWLWLHLLQASISNQTFSAKGDTEDMMKPWRPIPSGSLTPRQARVFR